MLEIRNALVEDAEDIIRINISSWQETYGGIFPKEFLDSLNELRDESIEKCKKKINEYIVATIDNKVVGFSRIGKNKKDYPDNYGEIYALYMDSNYKGQGIGKKIVDYSFSLLKNQYDHCLISALIENSANEFYKKIGGKNIGTCEYNLMDNNYTENIYEFEL